MDLKQREETYVLPASLLQEFVNVLQEMPLQGLARVGRQALLNDLAAHTTRQDAERDAQRRKDADAEIQARIDAAVKEAMKVAEVTGEAPAGASTPPAAS